MKAAAEDSDPGTVMDCIVWNALFKPDSARLEQGGFSDAELERIFAEEVLALFDGEEALIALAECIELHDRGPEEGDSLTPSAHLRMVKRLYRRWRRMRHIDKKHQEAVVHWMSDRKRAPSILVHGLVDLEWFEPESENQHDQTTEPEVVPKPDSQPSSDSGLDDDNPFYWDTE